MSKKFDVIVADPPWPFLDKLRMSAVKRGAVANYNVMTMSDIQQLPINNLCQTTGTVLCLWVPGSLLQQGLDTMKAWGFAHKQTYVWVKTKKVPLKSLGVIIKSRSTYLMSVPDYVRMAMKIAKEHFKLGNILSFGMGRLFRQTHEICLIGTSNNQIYNKLENKSQRSVCFAPNLKHSAKPEDLQDALEIMFPRAKKLELFARRERTGWTCLGNEVCQGEDIRVSLDKML